MSVSGFAARGNAVEGSYFRKEQEYALRKQLERLVQQGQLPQSALQQESALQLATDTRPNKTFVYQHVKGDWPGIFGARAVAASNAAVNLHQTMQLVWHANRLTILFPTCCSAKASDVMVHAWNTSQLWTRQVTLAYQIAKALAFQQQSVSIPLSHPIF